MKRMYVLLGVFTLLIVWAFNGFTQRPEDIREEIHRRMMESLMSDGFNDLPFEDLEKRMNDLMRDSFSTSFRTQSLKTQWQESDSGRTLLITPDSPEQKLDINIENSVISIKGKREVKTSQGSSISEFNNSFSVPADCDSSKVKMDQKEGKISIFFPWKAKVNGRVPVPKSKSDVTI